MELDEAIKHCEDKAKELRQEKRIMALIGREQEWADCLQCAEEHEQLAEWLTDYKRLKALENRPTGEMTNKEAIEKIDRVFNELNVCNAFDRPSFWTKNMSKYVVIDDKYHKGYQQALEDAERRIKEIFEEEDSNGNQEG